MTAHDDEWLVLEALCLDVTTAAGRQKFAGQVHPGLDWGYLLDQSLRHRMLTLLARTIVDLRLTDRLPLRVAEHLRGVVALNLHRRSVWYATAGRVLKALSDNGIAVAARKGAAYESTLYGGDGSRWLGDIDLLILPEDRDRAAALMPALGFETGIYDFDLDKVVPFERSELIKYRLNPDHLPTESITTGDPLVPVIEVDFANSLTWARAPYSVPVDEALEDVTWHRVPGFAELSVPVPRAEYQFVDTVLHLFREAWFDWWLEMEQDVDLMKFGDVVRLWRAHEPELIARVPAITRASAIEEPMSWVLTHLDRAFGLDIAGPLGLAGVATEQFLASAGNDRQGARTWSGDMRERLRASRRSELFARRLEG